MNDARWRIALALGTLLFVAIGSIAILTAKPNRPGATVTAQAVESYYIINCQTYTNIEGQPAIVLDYAKNGEVQNQAIFQSEKERDAFVRYLSSRGLVENRK
jgi:hypothetical protein